MSVVWGGYLTTRATADCLGVHGEYRAAKRQRCASARAPQRGGPRGRGL